MPVADLILSGGRILTLDDDARVMAALAIADGTIVAAGDSAEAMHFAGQATKIIDLQGRTVIPGLVDAHGHMDREGLKERLPSLAGCRSIDAIQARISALARRTPPGEWILTMPVGDPPEYQDVPQCLARDAFPAAMISTKRPRTTPSTSVRSGGRGATACRWCPSPTRRRSSLPA